MSSPPFRMHKARKLLIYICALLLLAISIGVTVEVVLRKIFNFSFGGIDELSGYGFAIFTSFSFIIAALDKANIRIDLLYSHSNRHIRIALDILAQFSLIIFSFLLTYRAILLTWNSYERGSTAITPLATPLVWPQLIWTSGLVLFSAILTGIFLISVYALMRNDTQLFKRMSSPVHEEFSPSSEDISSSDNRSI